MSWFSLRRQPPDPPAPSGQPLLNNRYRLGTVLGEGGGSQVVEADDLRTGRRVAVKLIRLPDALAPGQRDEWVARLHREAELARRLDHPDIVAVYEAGLQGTQAWLAMERVRGVDLSRYTQRHLLLPENLVLRIGCTHPHRHDTGHAGLHGA